MGDIGSFLVWYLVKGSTSTQPHPPPQKKKKKKAKHYFMWPVQPTCWLPIVHLQSVGALGQAQGEWWRKCSNTVFK